MEIGFIGLGKMGMNMVTRLRRGQHRVVVYDRATDLIKQAEQQGCVGATSLADLASKLAAPRTVWIMVPSGAPTEETMPIYDAAMLYKQDNRPLVVIAGKEYGTGSSRDWAAKGTVLLGVRAVIAESFERIHRSNLVGMGVLPLQFQEGRAPRLTASTGARSSPLQASRS